MPKTTPPHPGKILRQRLKDKGWTQEELALVTGRSRQSISGIVSGKSGITPDMALSLGIAFGNDPADWLQWNAQYELANTELDLAPIEQRARLFALAPIREMQKRGWISETDDLNLLQCDLEAFFGGPLHESILFPIAARRGVVQLAELSNSERAWCFRARQLATRIPTSGEFSPGRLGSLESKLRRLAAYPKEARKLSGVLSDHGVRFVVVEPLAGTKIDGAAFWLDNEKPVIAVSIRYDRIDAFWFTVMHEFAHIKHGDQHSVDSDLFHDMGNGITVALAEDEAERRANDTAADLLVPNSELESFMRRLAPFYSADRVVQFAHRIKMHPGIIVGQLQHRGEIGYSALRDFLVKIRSIVVETALTDGWGQSISPRLT